jgi:hypothetical protein
MAITATQAARLFALRPDICVRVFEELVQQGVLKHQWEGQYVVRNEPP